MWRRGEVTSVCMDDLTHEDYQHLGDNIEMITFVATKRNIEITLR